MAVLPGTDEFVLNRGLGHIEETALPGTGGNSGIAGHRDGFLRGLKDIAVGDAVELETLEGRQVYRVERMWIVEPEDVSVLDPTPVQSLTLVTCYPFYFIGSAPQRFIVRAVRAEEERRTSIVRRQHHETEIEGGRMFRAASSVVILVVGTLLGAAANASAQSSTASTTETKSFQDDHRRLATCWSSYGRSARGGISS